MRIVFVYTVEASLRTAVKGQIRFLAARGHDVHVVVAPDHTAQQWVEDEGGTYHGVQMTRASGDLLGDIGAARAILGVIEQVKPDLVVSGSPKAGLLGAVAGRLRGVPVVYVVHGLRLEGAQGPSRWALTAIEWVTCRTASRVVAVGEGLRSAAVRARVVSPERIDVVGRGSANGVDIDRFVRSPDRIRHGYTVGFVGRITHDKGVDDLMRAWPLVRESVLGARLMVVGAADKQNFEDLKLVQELQHLGADMRGFVRDAAPLFDEMDVLVLPSRREGLPTVVLEAGAASLPTIMYGCTGSEVVSDGHTGKIVPVGDWRELAREISALGNDLEQATRWGSHARTTVCADYAQTSVWTNYERYYEAAIAFAKRKPRE